MAVVGAAKEQFTSRRTSYDGKVWTASREWLVQTDSWADREDTVSGASGLPAYGAAHPGPIGAAMYAQTIDYEPFDAGTPMAWKVTAGYTSERQFDPTDPESDEVLVSFTGELYQEAVETDLNGDGIVNSAGDPFDPPATRDVADLIARIKSNHAAIPVAILNYQNAINSTAITIEGLNIGAGLAKHQRMEVGQRQKRGSTTYYPLTQEIHIRKAGWKLEPLDQGLREILLGKKRHILNESDLEEVTKPVPLNGMGVAITSATPGDITFLEFDLYEELDFTALPGIS